MEIDLTEIVDSRATFIFHRKQLNLRELIYKISRHDLKSIFISQTTNIRSVNKEGFENNKRKYELLTYSKVNL